MWAIISFHYFLLIWTSIVRLLSCTQYCLHLISNPSYTKNSRHDRHERADLIGAITPLAVGSRCTLRHRELRPRSQSLDQSW